MFRYRLWTPALLLAIFSTTPICAQTKLIAGSPEAIFAERLNRNINSMVAGQNAESEEFNAHIAVMNALQPLAPQHLDSTDVAANIARVMDFSNYLTGERHWSDSLLQSFGDSMYIMSEERPADLKVLDAANVEASFHEERAAINTFLSAMGKVYADVLDALLFLHHAHYTIKKKQPIFNTRSEMNEYIKLMDTVDVDSKALNKANLALREANAKANALTKQKESAWTP